MEPSTTHTERTRASQSRCQPHGWKSRSAATSFGPAASRRCCLVMPERAIREHLSRSISQPPANVYFIAWNPALPSTQLGLGVEIAALLCRDALARRRL